MSELPTLDDYLNFMVAVVKEKSLKEHREGINSVMRAVWLNWDTEKLPGEFIELANKRLEAEQSAYTLALENVHGPNHSGAGDHGHMITYHADLVLFHNKTEIVDKIIVDILILR